MNTHDLKIINHFTNDLVDFFTKVTQAFYFTKNAAPQNTLHFLFKDQNGDYDVCGGIPPSDVIGLIKFNESIKRNNEGSMLLCQFQTCYDGGKLDITVVNYMTKTVSGKTVNFEESTPCHATDNVLFMGSPICQN